ncbi:hypothetical protein [Elizabethkingia anophelis]|uniref:hypothetical protein n=1 Tax=Elizabethkingia anophelis TaxID=1117645 RepID=UPI00136AFBAB|nr:hypothetical protein [Elizabethkingia anophelis]MYY27384.1 hypothetical protein [Elizabethkingia anophelis]
MCDNSNKKEKTEKKEYLAPEVIVTRVEMEQGIAAGSSQVTPVVVDGNVDGVSTDWGTGDDTAVDTAF